MIMKTLGPWLCFNVRGGLVRRVSGFIVPWVTPVLLGAGGGVVGDVSLLIVTPGSGVCEDSIQDD